jgi:hypothetical protein
VDVYRVAVLYRGAGFGVRRSILLYRLLIIFAQASRAPSRSIPIREVFSLGLNNLTRLLISTESF